MLMIFAAENSTSIYELLGVVVSLVAAILSGWFAFLSYRQTQKISDRGLNVEGTKMLLDIDRCLMDDPRLWACLDDHPVRNTEEFRDAENTPIFKAKLDAFAHFVLNTFEIVLSETRRPNDCADQYLSKVWRNFFTDTISKSTILRTILDRDESLRILHPNMIELYRDWKGSTQTQTRSIDAGCPILGAAKGGMKKQNT